MNPLQLTEDEIVQLVLKTIAPKLLCSNPNEWRHKPPLYRLAFTLNPLLSKSKEQKKVSKRLHFAIQRDAVI